MSTKTLKRAIDRILTKDAPLGKPEGSASVAYKGYSIVKVENGYAVYDRGDELLIRNLSSIDVAKQAIDKVESEY